MTDQPMSMRIVYAPSWPHVCPIDGIDPMPPGTILKCPTCGRLYRCTGNVLDLPNNSHSTWEPCEPLEVAFWRLADWADRWLDKWFPRNQSRKGDNA